MALCLCGEVLSFILFNNATRANMFLVRIVWFLCCMPNAKEFDPRSVHSLAFHYIVVEVNLKVLLVFHAICT
jgi:hypothetical protein